MAKLNDKNNDKIENITHRSNVSKELGLKKREKPERLNFLILAQRQKK